MLDLDLVLRRKLRMRLLQCAFDGREAAPRQVFRHDVSFAVKEVMPGIFTLVHKCELIRMDQCVHSVLYP